jgi:hypothetical protein
MKAEEFINSEESYLELVSYVEDLTGLYGLMEAFAEHCVESHVKVGESLIGENKKLREGLLTKEEKDQLMDALVGTDLYQLACSLKVKH